MTGRRRPATPSLQGLRARWDARPAAYSRRVWALLLALDRLPRQWGEEIVARCYVAREFLRPWRLRRALAWASAQPSHERAPWRLARSLSAHYGRFVARSALLGIRDPESLRRLVEVRGTEHLDRAGQGVILLGFHLGPPHSYMALRIAGYRLTWVGGRAGTPLWCQEIRKLYLDPQENLFYSDDRRSWVRLLYQARQHLRRGESVFISADGEHGRVAFQMSLPGRPALIRNGWLALRHATGAAVVPVLSHLEGRTAIVVVHPALPPAVGDPARDLEACRRALEPIVRNYVRRFPEQCFSLAFPPGDRAARSRPWRARLLSRLD
jgi:lauroyl/myristoyl acyltransferase